MADCRSAASTICSASFQRSRPRSSPAPPPETTSPTTSTSAIRSSAKLPSRSESPSSQRRNNDVADLHRRRRDAVRQDPALGQLRCTRIAGSRRRRQRGLSSMAFRSTGDGATMPIRSGKLAGLASLRDDVAPDLPDPARRDGARPGRGLRRDPTRSAAVARSRGPFHLCRRTGSSRPGTAVAGLAANLRSTPRSIPSRAADVAASARRRHQRRQLHLQRHRRGELTATASTPGSTDAINAARLRSPTPDSAPATSLSSFGTASVELARGSAQDGFKRSRIPERPRLARDRRPVERRRRQHGRRIRRPAPARAELRGLVEADQRRSTSSSTRCSRRWADHAHRLHLHPVAVSTRRAIRPLRMQTELSKLNTEVTTSRHCRCRPDLGVDRGRSMTLHSTAPRSTCRSPAMAVPRRA